MTRLIKKRGWSGFSDVEGDPVEMDRAGRTNSIVHLASLAGQRIRDVGQPAIYGLCYIGFPYRSLVIVRVRSR